MWIVLWLLFSPILIWGFILDIRNGLRASNKPIDERTFQDHETIRKGRTTAFGAIIMILFAMWLYGETY